MTKQQAIEYLTNKIPDDEPVFVFRAQDALADDVIETWSIRAGSAGCNHDKVLAARACVDEMRRWPVRKNPD